MAHSVKEHQRAELHKTIWQVANDLRGAVDGWGFKSYVLGMLFYRFISENLKPEETERFVQAAFRDGALRTTGTAITKVLPPVSRFSKDKHHSAKKQRVVQLLGDFFERFFGLGIGGAN